MKKKTILIAEDEPVIALDYRVFFEKRGYETIVLQSATEVIKSIRKKKPDFGLVDIRLFKDGNAGIRIGTELQNLNIPFVFISGFPDPMVYEEAIKLKPVHIFLKPVNLHNVHGHII